MRLFVILALVLCLFAAAPAQANPPLQFAPCVQQAPVYFQQPQAFFVQRSPVFYQSAAFLRAPVYSAPVFRQPVFVPRQRNFFAAAPVAGINIQIDNSRRGLFGRR